MEENPTCVVIVSGSRESSQIERAERAGAMDYVVKPLHAHQIQPVLARAQRRFERCMRIRREAGNPEEALETWLVARSGGQERARATTGAKGMYVMESDLLAGTYLVSVSKPGWVTQTKTDREVVAGETTYVNFNLQPQ